MKNNLHIAFRAILIFIAFAGCYSTAFSQNWDQIIKANAADRNDKATGVRSKDDGYGASVAISGDYALVPGKSRKIWKETIRSNRRALPIFYIVPMVSGSS